MKNLWITLPAYAPDYSGICSAFFDLGGISVIHDASGCTGNYTGYDEPRWFEGTAKVFCSGLREIDAVLGDDEKLLENIIRAGEELGPSVYALIGSPVPMVIGSDMKGIARELEARTGVPSFGFDANGLHLYDEGISQALCSLIRRFTKTPAEKVAGGVNLLGTNPLDFSANGDDERLERSIQERGYRVLGRMMMGASIEQIERLAEAELNLVVSVCGLAAAKLMEKEFGIPYVAGNIVAHSDAVLQAMEQSIAERKSRAISDPAGNGILVIGEQITSNCIRRAILEKTPLAGVTVAAMTGFETELAAAGDIALTDEDSVCTLLESGRFGVVIADPLFADLPQMKNLRMYALPHAALSSKLYWNSAPHLIGDDLEKIICAAACEMS